MKDYIVVSFSGGKDSTAMLLRMIELGEHIDEVVCCDTYKEFPAMYRHIEKIQKVVEAAGIKFTMLRAEKDFDWWMFEYIPQKENSKLLNRGVSGWSWAGARARWCTNYLKVRVVDGHMRELKKFFNVIRYIGIAADELYRLETKCSQGKSVFYPLVKWGWSEERCLQYCYSKGYDWEGLYEVFRIDTRSPRLSCWCCPLQSLKSLRILCKQFPDLWRKLREMDERTWRDFKQGWSVENLDIRFQFEEERLAQGLSITNRDFHTKLKGRLRR